MERVNRNLIPCPRYSASVSFRWCFCGKIQWRVEVEFVPKSSSRRWRWRFSRCEWCSRNIRLWVWMRGTCGWWSTLDPRWPPSSWTSKPTGRRMNKTYVEETCFQGCIKLDIFFSSFLFYPHLSPLTVWLKLPLLVFGFDRHCKREWHSRERYTSTG